MSAGQGSAENFTTAMAFLEPTMQDFLAQSDFDVGLVPHYPVDALMFMDDAVDGDGDGDGQGRRERGGLYGYGV